MAVISHGANSVIPQHPLIGYARVSTDEQTVDQQVDALTAAGCETVYRDIGSGHSRKRPELVRMMERLCPGAVVVVWKLDRLGRSLRDLIDILDVFGERSVGFRSLTEAIDTTSPAGVALMQMIGVFAQFERSMLIERTKAGLERAKRDGVRLGRPLKLNGRQRDQVLKLVREGRTHKEVAELVGVSRSTVTRLVGMDTERSV